MRFTLALTALIGLAACSNPNVANAVLGTAIAGGASAYQRSTGGCYASCPPGTSCVEETGFCEPCGGKCAPGERCERVGGESRCLRIEPVTTGPAEP